MLTRISGIEANDQAMKNIKSIAPYALVALGLIAISGKRKISGVSIPAPTKDNALAYGIVAVGGYFLVVDPILKKLGILDSKQTKDLNNESVNPLSPWNIQFWQKGPAGTHLLTTAEIINFYAILQNSFSVFGDNESAVIAAFKTLKYKSQLSYLAYQFNLSFKLDLLTYLRGDKFPNDRLSDDEVAEINDYIKKLPNY